MASKLCMKTLYTIVMIIACGISIAAQEKVITEAEYTEAVSRAEKSLYAGTHGPIRQTMDNEVLTEGQPDYRVKSVSMIVPGQASHRIEDRSFGGKPSKTETLTVNDRLFTRGADGVWKEVAAASRSASAPAREPSSESRPSERESVYKYIGTERSGDRAVHIYTKAERRKTINPDTGATSESETITRVSIGTDGTYLRNELNTKNSFSGKTGHVKIVIEVQADPTIKIVAPDVS